MSLINLLFLPAIFFIGAITTYEDAVLSRIRNKWIILSLVYAVTGYLLLYLLSFFKVIDYGGVNYHYLMAHAINLGLSIFAAYGFWKYGAWAPGDAKLFIVYSTLIPLDFYSKGYINYFPSLVLLFNIFIPIFLVIVITAPFKLLGIAVSLVRDPEKLKKAIESGGRSFGGSTQKAGSFLFEHMGMLAAYLLVFCALQAALRRIGLGSVWIAVMLLLAQPLIQRIRKKRRILLGMIITALGYFGYKAIYGQGLSELLPFFRQIFKVFALFWILRIMLAAYVKYTQVRKIEISQLQPNMIPAEETLKVLQSASKELQQVVGPVYPEGFSKEQAERVKSLYMEKGLERIEVYRAFPFAAWMFLGVAITLLSRQSIFTLIRLFLRCL